MESKDKTIIEPHYNADKGYCDGVRIRTKTEDFVVGLTSIAARANREMVIEASRQLHRKTPTVKQMELIDANASDIDYMMYRIGRGDKIKDAQYYWVRNNAGELRCYDTRLHSLRRMSKESLNNPYALYQFRGIVIDYAKI